MLKRKPYYLLLLMAIVFIGLCFFTTADATLDINVHDTYYIIAYSHLYGLLAVILFTLFAFYWSLEKAEMMWIEMLSKIHVYGTVVSMIGMFFPYAFVFDFYNDSHFPLHDTSGNVNLCLTISALLFLFFQLLFIINIFVAIIKKLCN